MNPPLLAVSGISVAYKRGLSSKYSVQAVRGVSFSAWRGRTLGLIGESGSGKSSALNAVAGLVKPIAGEIIFDGKPVGKRRPGMSMIFQSGAIDPKMRIADVVAEPLRNHKRMPAKDERAAVIKLLEMVGLPSAFMERLPWELSGGQLQRAGIARALALRPSLLLADEPVTALDPDAKEQILDLLARLIKEFRMACVFVTHDLEAARYLCDAFCIMQNGEIVERGGVYRIFNEPQQAYTKLLLESGAVCAG
ncbi:MAG: dipeptide/oligopeptide/nickel ABC transporter ATP-binding protein [Clostridiales bacterium]|jgi:ABC-type glutathione transport system ATPase component|nr:dipeptide/oligopeptide/nickel ABC transporter ATP-binding protein [Clostridiales bacterium]